MTDIVKAHHDELAGTEADSIRAVAAEKKRWLSCRTRAQGRPVNKKTPKKPRVGDGTPGPGRPPGAQNKVTATVKMMVLGALEMLGGQAWLVRQAKKNPQAFMQMLRQVMPTQVVGDVNYRYVAEMPPPESDPEEWIKKYGPKTTHQAPETKL